MKDLIEDRELTEIFRRSNDFILEGFQKNEVVLLHCRMGRSRSAVLALGYLIQVRGETLD